MKTCHECKKQVSGNNGNYRQTKIRLMEDGYDGRSAGSKWEERWFCLDCQIQTLNERIEDTKDTIVFLEKERATLERRNKIQSVRSEEKT